MNIILETPRLALRQFTEADAPLLHWLNSNPEVVKYVHEPTLQSEEEAREIILRNILPQYENMLGRWAIYTKDRNEFIGWCGLKYLPQTGEIDLGYRLHPSAWGQGYATESAKHVLGYGFQKLHLTEVFGKAHKENAASIKVLEKIGMRFIGEAMEDDCPIKIYHAQHTNLTPLNT